MLKQNSPGGLSPYLDAGAQRIAAELEAHLVITLKHTGRHCGAALGGVPPPHQPIGATSFSPFRMGGRGAALELYPWYSTRVVVHVDTAAHVYVHTVLRMMPCAMLESPDVSLLQEQEQNAAESKGDVFWGANCPNGGH